MNARLIREKIMQNMFKHAPIDELSAYYLKGFRRDMEEWGMKREQIETLNILEMGDTPTDKHVLEKVTVMRGYFCHNTYALMCHEVMESKDATRFEISDSSSRLFSRLSSHGLASFYRTLSIKDDGLRLKVLESMLRFSIDENSFAPSYEYEHLKPIDSAPCKADIDKIEALSILRAFGFTHVDTQEYWGDRYALLNENVLSAPKATKKDLAHRMMGIEPRSSLIESFSQRYLGAQAILARMSGMPCREILDALDPFLETIFEIAAQKSDTFEQDQQNFVRLSKIQMFLCDNEMMSELNFNLADLKPFEYKLKNESIAEVNIAEGIAPHDSDIALDRLKDCLEGLGEKMEWKHILDMDNSIFGRSTLVVAEFKFLKTMNPKSINRFMRTTIAHDIWKSNKPIIFSGYGFDIPDIPEDVAKEMIVRKVEGNDTMPISRLRVTKDGMKDSIMLSLLEEGRLTPHIMEWLDGDYDVIKKSGLPMPKELRRKSIENDFGM